MADFSELREPIEVYLAAAGDPKPLADRIESRAELHAWERQAIALFLRGELQRPDQNGSLKFRSRGKKRVSYMPLRERDHIALNAQRAAETYRFYMSELRRSGTAHNKSDIVTEQVAREFSITPDAVRNALKSSPNTRKQCPSEEETNSLVQRYHAWLFNTGRLKSYEPDARFLPMPHPLWKHFVRDEDQ